MPPNGLNWKMKVQIMETQKIYKNNPNFALKFLPFKMHRKIPHLPENHEQLRLLVSHHQKYEFLTMETEIQLF